MIDGGKLDELLDDLLEDAGVGGVEAFMDELRRWRLDEMRATLREVYELGRKDGLCEARPVLSLAAGLLAGFGYKATSADLLALRDGRKREE
jgi:hypothetical protein